MIFLCWYFSGMCLTLVWLLFAAPKIDKRHLAKAMLWASLWSIYITYGIIAVTCEIFNVTYAHVDAFIWKIDSKLNDIVYYIFRGIE